jgi:hypothetical protein
VLEISMDAWDDAKGRPLKPNQLMSIESLMPVRVNLGILQSMQDGDRKSARQQTDLRGDACRQEASRETYTVRTEEERHKQLQFLTAH